MKDVEAAARASPEGRRKGSRVRGRGNRFGPNDGRGRRPVRAATRSTAAAASPVTGRNADQVPCQVDGVFVVPGNRLRREPRRGPARRVAPVRAVVVVVVMTARGMVVRGRVSAGGRAHMDVPAMVVTGGRRAGVGVGR